MKMIVKFNMTHTRIYALVVAILGAIWLGGCKPETITYSGDGFVRFTDTTLAYKEYVTNAIPVRVHNGGKVLDQSITVNYTVSGSAREGRDYSINGTKGRVVIPAGKSFGEISVQLINNANNILESSNVIFTITSVSPSNLAIGFSKGGIGKSTILTIQDACLLEGIYTGNLPVGAQFYQTPNISITSTDCRNYTVQNINVGFLGFQQFFGWLNLLSFEAEEPKLTFIDNGNNTLTIPRQVIGEFPAGFDTVSGTGLYNPQNKRLTLNLRLKIRKASNRRDSIVTVPLIYTP